MRRIIILGHLLLIGYVGLSQQQPQFSQFMLNKSFWCPAMTAVDNQTSVYAMSRSQWTGYQTSFPQQGSRIATQFASFSTPLNIKKLNFGIGGNAIYDELGPKINKEIQLNLAYHKHYPRGTMSIGLRPSINNQTVNFNEFTFIDEQNEPLNIDQKLSQMVFDMAAGIGYSNESFEISVGASQLMRPTYNYGLDNVENDNKPVDIIYNTFAQYNYIITYDLTLSPSALVQTDINAFTYSIAMIATYKTKLWAGLSYKNAEAAVLLMGYSFLEENELKVGYSFDYVVKDRSAKQATSHEIYLRFNLPTIDTGSKKIIRTPRFRY